MYTKEKEVKRLKSKVKGYNCLFCFRNVWNVSETREGSIEIVCTNCGYEAHFSRMILDILNSGE